VTQRKLNIDGLQKIVSRVSLGDVLYQGWKFRLMEKGDGFLVQLVYMEVDTDAPADVSSVPVEQAARKWYVSPYSTTTEVVRTLHKAVMASLEHRLGEHFTYQGAKVYSPHLPIDALEGVVNYIELDGRVPKEAR